MMAALTDQPAVLVPRILISSHFDVLHGTLCKFSFNTFQGCTKICVVRSNIGIIMTECFNMRAAAGDAECRRLRGRGGTDQHAVKEITPIALALRLGSNIA